MVLARYSELALKSPRVRKRLERLLIDNIERQTGGRARKEASRIIVEGAPVEEVARVFGVKSASPAIRVRSDMGEIREAALSLYKGGTFAVRARRVTKDFPLTSMEIAKEVGSHIVEQGGKVDLINPGTEIGIEIVGKHAYIYTTTYEGPGGLPVGSQGRGVLLFSGGIDSPVAGWMMGKRGVEVHPLYVKLGVPPFNVLDRLSSWFPYEMTLEMVEGEEVARKLYEGLERRGKLPYMNLLLKVYMYREGERYAEEIGADMIITGESLGQVSSQTARNLRLLDETVSIMVARPLIGMNKEEIEEVARKIGTYEESIQLPEPCKFLKVKPVTRADPEVFRELVEEVL